MTDALSRFWFKPAPAARLGVLRVAAGGFGLWYVATRLEVLAQVARKDASLFAPVGLFRVLSGPLNPALFDWIAWLTVLSGVLFVLGFAHRKVGPVFALLLLATLCYRNSWSMVYHSDGALVMHVLILGFARSADAFSIDSLLRRRDGAAPAGEDESYGWPIKLICAVTVAGYLLSGVAKVAGPEGLRWAMGSALREQIATDTIRKEILEGGGMPLAYALYDSLWLFTLMGVGTLVLELAAPLATMNRRGGRVWAVCTWSMHWGIFLIMGIRFRYQMSFLIFLPFFDCEKLLAVRRLVSAGRRRRVVPVMP